MSDFDPETYRRESRQAWSDAAGRYDAMSRRLFEGLTAEFIRFAGLRPGQAVLDVACGAGIASVEAAKSVGPGGKVVAADLAPGMLALAKEALAGTGVPFEPREAGAEALPFPDASFDAVVCQLGLMLFAEPDKALSEMRRVLKPGGRAACLVQGTAEKMVFTSLVMKTAVKYAPHLKVPGAPTLYTFGPPGVLEEAFRRAGFSDVESRRLEGRFELASFDDYWELLTSGGGRIRAALASLEPEDARRLKEECRGLASAYRTDGGRLAIPYELVLAAGVR